jgi:DNA-directed RNA polymerase subunit RPC12/RpoP
LLNRRPSPENNAVDDTADPDTQPDAYLAPHQASSTGKSTRLNRWLLLSFGSRLLICSTCKESYHGMRTNGSQCERCSNEVLYFSFHRSVPLFLNTVRRFYLAQRTSF